MPLEVKKREGESPSALLFRFTKKVKRSGVLREGRARRFRGRGISRIKRRVSALHREEKKKEIERMKKLGLL
ncbi:MAG: hypothetical protein AAB897_02985 [Patescibacteria group bacterium]